MSERFGTRIVATVVALGTALALYPAFVGATHKDITEGDDTPGVLDIKLVRTWGKERTPAWRIGTLGRWSSWGIWDSGFFLVYLDTFSTRRADYYVLVRSNGFGMDADLLRDYKNRRDRRVAELHEYRRDDRSVTVVVPLSKMKMGEARGYYRWRVVTLNNNTCPHVCIDRAPNGGGVVKEPIPGASPSASLIE